MNLYTELPDHIQEVDVVITGGGSAGCVVAARLAESDPSLSILVIERGPNNNLPTVASPALFMAHLLPTSNTTIFYQSKNEAQLNNRSMVVPAGSVLGGGSSINMMMYSRPQRSDFDSWETPGWTASEMLPYLKKLETYHGPEDSNTHGHDGPINITRGTFSSTRFEDQFIAAAGKMGYPEKTDMQSLDSVNGIYRAFRFINAEGKREDAATRYLLPLLQGGSHPNLHVLLESEALRVLFDNDKRASGVEFRPNPAFRTGQPRCVKARKLVIMSSGALGTPALLERSGVGSTEVLQSANVPIVAENPGVGREYEDHHLVLYAYRSSLNSEETLDALAQGRLDPAELLRTNDKILGCNGQDVTAKVRPTDEEAAALGPEFEAAWNREFRDFPDRPLSIVTGVCVAPIPTLDPGQYFSISVFTLYPFSRGKVHITGPSVEDPLDFETGFLKDPLDVTKQMWAYKKQREIARRMPIYRGEVAVLHPPFPADSAAALVELDGPPSEDVSDIQYTAEDDEILKNWLRDNISTTWHSVGTCKMRPQELNGAVDNSLNVYGVKGLKIADLSILPRNVAANTNCIALAVGEKAADIFKAELASGC